MPVLFLVFVLVPLAEIYVLIRVGSSIGAWPTIALVVLTALVGVALLRQQGLITLGRGLQRLDRGELPLTQMLEGLMLALAGAMLLTPGFLTDLLGFALLVPAFRRFSLRWLAKRAGFWQLGMRMSRGWQAGPGRGPVRGPGSDPDPGAGPDGGRTLDGDFERRS